MGRGETSEPWCVIGKCSWGVVQAIKMPEARAALYVEKHGWIVLISDSEMPVDPPPITWPVQSNPRRIAEHGASE